MVTISIQIDEEDVHELDRLIAVRKGIADPHEDAEMEEQMIEYRDDAIRGAIKNYIRLHQQIEQHFVEREVKELKAMFRSPRRGK